MTFLRLIILVFEVLAVTFLGVSDSIDAWQDEPVTRGIVLDDDRDAAAPEQPPLVTAPPAPAPQATPPPPPVVAAPPPQAAPPVPPQARPWDGGNVAPGREPPIADLFPEAAPPPEAIISGADPFPVEAPEDGSYATVELYFATNRVMDPSADLSERFTGELGELVYGTATVSIPRIHQPGVLESQSWLVSLIMAPNPEKHVIVQHLGVRDADQVLAMMNAEARAGNGGVLAYIHGYNTSFDKAARRMGQMSYDLGWDGTSFFYSWPSRAQAGLYFTDDTAADRSIRVMKEVLTDLGRLPDADRIILIGHSMGTRVLTEALQQLVTEGHPVASRITAVILAAPDIDKDVFINDIAPRLTQMEQARVTLYASSEDSALKASRAARGFTRMGDTSDGLVLVEGIEIVDATGAESDFFGHTYFGDNATIIDDMFDLIHNGMAADERPMLEPVARADGIYWRIANPR